MADARHAALVEPPANRVLGPGPLRSYFVGAAFRSSCLIFAMFAAIRRVSLRLPETLRRLGLVL